MYCISLFPLFLPTFQSIPESIVDHVDSTGIHRRNKGYKGYKLLMTAQHDGSYGNVEGISLGVSGGNGSSRRINLTLLTSSNRLHTQFVIVVILT